MKFTNVIKNTAAILIAALPAHALAQQTGTYNGTSADGSAIQIVVGTDSSNGDFEVTGASIGFQALCKSTNTVFDSGWGFGQSTDIINGQAPLLLDFAYAYISSPVMTFHGTTTVTGRIETLTPMLIPPSPPTKAEFCKSKSQSFTATWSSPNHAPTVPEGAAAVSYGVAKQ